MSRAKDGRPAPADVNVISLKAGGDFITEFDSSSVVSHPSTRISHTVTTGKMFQIFNWHFETENAIGKVELQIDGVAIDSIRFSNSSSTNRISVDFGLVPKQATAGQVVRVQSISGDTGKEFTVGFVGTEIDV